MNRQGNRYLQIAAYLLITAIFVFIIGIARNCTNISSGPKEGFSGSDTLDIAILYGPASYYLYEEDSIGGINLDIERQFTEATGTPAKIWLKTDPADALKKLDSGAFDIVASLPLDNALRKKYPVSESVFLDCLVLIELKDSVTGLPAVKSSMDLDGKTIHVAAGSSGINRLNNLSKESRSISFEVVEEPDLSDELIAIKVAEGSLPYGLVNERIAKSLALAYPNLHYNNTISFTQNQVWVFAPGDTAISEKFNRWFDEFRLTNQYREIINKY